MVAGHQGVSDKKADQRQIYPAACSLAVVLASKCILYSHCQLDESLSRAFHHTGFAVDTMNGLLYAIGPKLYIHQKKAS
jgi:hypothetical protein